MVENRPWLTLVQHLVLALGIAIVALPIWVTFVASTHPPEHMIRAPIPMWPGDRLIENYGEVLSGGGATAGGGPGGATSFKSTASAVGHTAA